MKISIAVLLASILIAIGSWGSGFNNWDQLKEISNVFSLLGVIGSVVIAWRGKSPIKPQQ